MCSVIISVSDYGNFVSVTVFVSELCDLIQATIPLTGDGSLFCVLLTTSA